MALKFLNNGYFAGKVGIGTETSYTVGGTAQVTIATGSAETALAFGPSNNDMLYMRSAGSQGNFQFQTSVNNGNSGSVQLQPFGGKVGIGTDSPSEKLEVSGSNSLSIKLSRNNTDSTYTTTLTNNYDSTLGTELKSGDYNILTHGNSTGTSLNFTNGAMTFDFRDSEKMRITDAGNVGIGTTSPVAKLDVLGTSGGPTVFDYSYATNAGLRIHGDESAMDIVGTDSGNHASTILLRNGNEGFGLLNNPNLNTLQFRSFTATADAFNIHDTGSGLSSLVDIITLEKTGNVGIGTDSPGAKLDVVGGSLNVSDTYGTVKIIGTGGLSRVFLGDTADEDVGYLEYNHISNYFRIGVNATEKMRITSSGILMVGGTTGGYAGTKIHVGNFTDTQNGINILTSTTGYGYVLFGDGTGADTYRGQITYNHADDSMSFNTNGSEKLRIVSGGGISFAGATNFGSAGQVLKSNGSASPAWVDASTVIGGPYLPLSAGSSYPLTGALYVQDHLILQQDGTNDLIKSTGNVLYHKANEYSFQDNSNNSWVTIKSGNVGIGTTNPADKLDVNGNINIGNTGSGVRGIKRSNDGYNLHLAGGSSLTGGAYIEVNGGSRGGIGTSLNGEIKLVSGGSYQSSQGALVGDYYFNTQWNGGSATLMKIDSSSGNVGIGVASPGAKLDIVGSSLGIRVKKADLSDVLRVYTQGSGIFMNNGNVHISDDLKIGATLLSNQENTDIDSAASEVVAQVAHATYTAAFFDFVIKKGTNVRSGTVYACHNGDTTPLVEFTETSTNDLGDTSDVTLSVDISGTNMRLLATVTSDDWSVKSLIRAI